MQRVTGIGGVFIKAKDHKMLREWYEKHLGIESVKNGYFNFAWGGEKAGNTVWSVFAGDTKYFEPSQSPFMINYRVADLDGLIKALREEGVKVEEKVEEFEYGKFGWCYDPEGNKIELWEPKDESLTTG